MQVDAMMDQDDNFNGYSVGLPGFFLRLSNFGSAHSMRLKSPTGNSPSERFVAFFWKRMKMAWMYDPSLEGYGNNAFGRSQSGMLMSAQSNFIKRSEAKQPGRGNCFEFPYSLWMVENMDCNFLEFHNSDI